jgi:hypothetical protein
MSTRRRQSAALRVAKVISAVGATIVAVAILILFAYAAHTWNGYGSAQPDRMPDPGLDHFMPVYDIDEQYEIAVAAPWTNTYAAECLMNLEDSPVIGAILKARQALLRATPDPDASQQPSSFLAQAISLGWGVLAEDPGHEIIVGAVSQPWEHDVAFEALAPDRFESFQTPGYAKIVWTLDAEPNGPDTSIARTVTRVETTDADSRSKFRRYWSTFSPGILVFRQQALALVKDAAERGFRANGTAPAATCAATESR